MGDLSVPRGHTTLVVGASELNASQSSVLLIILSGILWGTSGVFAKPIYATGGLGPLGLSLWRGCLALPAIAALILPTRSRVRKPSLSDLPWIVALGFAGYALFQVLYLNALVRTTVAHAAALLYVSPILVAVMSRLAFKEEITLAKAAGIFLAILGAALVVGISRGARPFDSRTLIGDVLAIGAGGAYSTWYLFGKKLTQRFEPAAAFLFAISFGTVILIVPTWACEGIQIAWSASLWLLVAGVALIPTATAYAFYLHGLRTVEPTRASVYTMTEPISAAFFAYVVLGETPAPDAMLGVILILASIAIV